MVRTYVLVQTTIGKAATTASELSRIRGVIRSDNVLGPFDVIVTAEAERTDLLDQIVAQIQAVEGIASVRTCPVSYTSPLWTDLTS
ncbi:Lrp/AsnC ligand binding domain-containing protein [Streptomyces violascens]|uniref:Lrp/AsnC ligand binding domain-containing protein n=1 Tax=Streptomyces violascens TaxID=67381 RepID=UPI0036B83301